MTTLPSRVLTATEVVQPVASTLAISMQQYPLLSRGKHRTCDATKKNQDPPVERNPSDGEETCSYHSSDITVSRRVYKYEKLT